MSAQDDSRAPQPTVEILTFQGCPNAAATRELVARAVADVCIDARIVDVNVPDVAAAEGLRFLGSPTIRVNGNDIEPGADERTAYVFACRIYRTSSGMTGVPDETWLRDALTARTAPS